MPAEAFGPDQVFLFLSSGFFFFFRIHFPEFRVDSPEKIGKAMEAADIIDQHFTVPRDEDRTVDLSAFDVGPVQSSLGNSAGGHQVRAVFTGCDPDLPVVSEIIVVKKDICHRCGQGLGQRGINLILYDPADTVL